MKPKFYLTTPIYYPNARPHVGSAYTTIVCDVIARYKRMCGYDVRFLTGTDEHGEKIQRAALAEGKTPGDFVASKRELFKKLWRFLNISDYKFVHTSQNPDHVRSVQWMLRQADKNGYIQKKKYAGRYCIDDERYISDSAEPVNCDICGRPAELISEDNYFFKLSRFGGEDGPLMRLYHENPSFVLPYFRMNEVKSFVRSGLRDISVSRKRIKWGIPWPDDHEQVFYVWYDALTSYLTGIGFRGESRSAEFEKYWMGVDGPTEIVHMIGKDILRFHAVYWPAFLIAAGLPLPKTVFAHGWIYYEEDKMSKSKGNVVYPEPIIEALDSFGAPGNDALRYYVLRDTPFGQDSSFSYEGLIQRFNSDLANDLGNLANRTVTMIDRYFSGIVPSPKAGRTQREDNLEAVASATADTVRDTFGKYQFSQGLASIWDLIAEANKYLVVTLPWDLAEKDFKANEPRVATILYTAAEAVRFCAVLLAPVIPQSAKRLWKQLGGEGNISEQRLDDLKWGQLKPGTRVTKPEIIFPRLDKEAGLAKLHELAEADLERDKPKEAPIFVQKETGKSEQNAARPVTESRTPNPESRTPAPSPAQISIDDFAKIEMRVGEVISAERVEGAQRLLKVMVDIGTEVRQVVAGIAEHYQPEQLAGMKVVVVTNLQPRKLRGVESNGMIVAASVGEEGRPVLVTFKEDVPKGAKLK